MENSSLFNLCLRPLTFVCISLVLLGFTCTTIHARMEALEKSEMRSITAYEGIELKFNFELSTNSITFQDVEGTNGFNGADVVVSGVGGGIDIGNVDPSSNVEINVDGTKFLNVKLDDSDILGIDLRLGTSGPIDIEDGGSSTILLNELRFTNPQTGGPAEFNLNGDLRMFSLDT